MKKRFCTIPAGPFLSPDVFPQCVGIFGNFKMINILTYVSKRRSEASVSSFLKSLEMDHFRCSVAPQIPMFSLYCIFSISIGALHVIGYKNIHAFGCAATAATNPRVTIRIDGKSDASAQTRTRRAARERRAYDSDPRASSLVHHRPLVRGLRPFTFALALLASVPIMQPIQFPCNIRPSGSLLWTADDKSTGSSPVEQ